MKRPFLVSTDCAAVLGDMHLVKQLWSNVLTDPACKGVEMIGWKWTPTLMREAKRIHLPVRGIHGRTGGWREEKDLKGRMVMGTLNDIFITTENLIHTSRQVDYVLLHRSSLSEAVVNLLCAHRAQLGHVCIENVIAPNDVERTFEAVSFLQSQKVPVGMMFDLVHFLREPYFKSPHLTRFDGLLAALSQAAKMPFRIDIHLPIGSYVNDSLPLKHITNRMWEELGDVLNRVNPHFIVLENQQERAYSLYLPKWKRADVTKRNHWVYEFLKDKNIL